MDVLYLDCLSGLSGNMFLGAMMDLGFEMEILKREISKLDLKGYSFHKEKITKKGIACTFFDVDLDWDLIKKGDLPEKTSPQEIYEKISSSSLSEFVKEKSLSLFRHNVEAKMKIFEKKEEEISFHSVELIDTYIDFVGAALAVEWLKPDKIFASSIHDGTGHFKSRSGVRIIPDPLVLELLSQKKAPLHTTNIRAQLVTVTGAGILREFVDEFIPMDFKINQVGYGCGSSDFEIPNVLRAITGSKIAQKKFF